MYTQVATRASCAKYVNSPLETHATRVGRGVQAFMLWRSRRSSAVPTAGVAAALGKATIEDRSSQVIVGHRAKSMP